MKGDTLQYLRIKRTNLAQEARLIRKGEWAYRRRAKKCLKDSAEQGEALTTAAQQTSHRVTVVRNEARSAHLAHAFLSGRNLRDVEEEGSSEPDLRRVREIAYGFRGNLFEDDADFEESFDTWCWYAGYDDPSKWARKKRKQQYTYNTFPQRDEDEEVDTSFPWLAIVISALLAAGFITAEMLNPPSFQALKNFFGLN